METHGTIQERVARGAAWLDGEHPGWRDAINLGNFTVGSCTRCVLGQILGDYDGSALLAAELHPEDHGFMWVSETCTTQMHVEVAALNAEWKRVIHASRVRESARV